MTHVGAGLFHTPGKVETRGDGQGRFRQVFAAPDQHIGEIEPRVFHLHEHLVGAGFRYGQFADGQNIRRTGVFQANGFHAGPLLRVPARCARTQETQVVG
ncbi:MAG: hypothetical protein M5R36_25395 [Deltaproteobacteria bacterium]|nr:hypothetical protein [Deltaproteobacteria bacterium]